MRACAFIEWTVGRHVIGKVFRRNKRLGEGRKRVSVSLRRCLIITFIDLRDRSIDRSIERRSSIVSTQRMENKREEKR